VAITREVAENIFLIDDELYSIPGHGAVYFLAEEKQVLVDSGPASSARKVLEGISQLGFNSQEIEFIVLTHIHLDHAGGTGTLLKEMPRAKVLAHPRGIKHLLNPSKLVKSAIEALGEDTMARNGLVLPVEPERLAPAIDGETLKLSDRQQLTFLDCPGHAPHEICIFESRNQGVFVGDAVGHIIEGTDVMIPVTPPPSFDLELYLQSLHRLMGLNASRIYFPHSGTSTQVQEKLKAAEEELLAWDEIIARAAAENKIGSAAARVVKHALDRLEVIRTDMKDVYDYWANNDVRMSADEHVRYYKRKHGLQEMEVRK
jgi:glyoxylase-like metal-dependent hydrolase (beta-lactamase superfamily II)